MIVRTWTGWTARADSRRYEAYMHEVALPGYAGVDGSRGVLMLKREVEGDRTEFVMISLWRDMAAIHAFAGEDPAKAVFYAADDEFLVDRWSEVHHHEVFGATSRLGADLRDRSATGHREEPPR